MMSIAAASNLVQAQAAIYLAPAYLEAWDVVGRVSARRCGGRLRWKIGFGKKSTLNFGKRVVSSIFTPFFGIMVNSSY